MSTALSPAPADTANSSAALRRRILVVDDVEENRDILTRRLTRRGFDIVEAAGGISALEAIATQSFDVILLDIMMPDLTGNEVLREVRRTLSQAELPIIMVSAKSQSEDVVQSLELGANDYVTKPVDFAVALARINTQIERKAAADRARAASASLETSIQQQQQALHETQQSLVAETDQRKLSEEKLEYMAFHDALTGLLNRAAFHSQLDAELSAPDATELTLVFIDLDRFKAVNDDKGHEVGDQLLRDVAVRLRAALGPDALLGRLGGDEFAALLPRRESHRAVEMAAQVIAALSAPFESLGQTCLIGASCGIARPYAALTTADELINAADLAMYCAKSTGRNRAVVFESHMLEDQREKRALENDLRIAIQQGAFDILYQPLVSTATGSVISFEALLRWPHPTRGMISPERFIPLAEETGLIVGLGAWVLRQACAEAATWPGDIHVAVNLSPLQFASKNLLPTLLNALATTGLAPHRLELEITESALLHTQEFNLSVLRAIRELGVRISIDDFGTGYSSMSYLSDFRFDKIKIDRRFSCDLDAGSTNSAIVKAIVEMGDRIGITTTAEGIETAEQLAHIIAHGCNEVQGFFISRPVSSDNVPTIVRTTHR